MSLQNNSRTTDLGALLTDGTSGFVVRKTTGVGMFFHFFLLACMVLLGAALLVYYKSPKGCFLAVAIGCSFALIAMNLEKYKKMKQSLEFMNALFSSAAGKGYKFCCIVKFSGEIVFYNRPFQAVFPAYTQQDDRTLGSLLHLYNIPQDDRTKLQALMKDKQDGTIDTTVNDIKTTFLIEAIERPTGFFMIRGK